MTFQKNKFPDKDYPLGFVCSSPFILLVQFARRCQIGEHLDLIVDQQKKGRVDISTERVKKKKKSEKIDQRNSSTVKTKAESKTKRKSP